MKLATFVASLGILVVLTGHAFGQEKGSSAPEMREFFAVAENRRAYESAVADGRIEAGREKFHTACLEQKDRGKKVDCACYRRELQTTPDDVFFYETVLAYREYVEKVSALGNDDMQKYEALKKQHAARDSLLKRLEQTCGKL